ncbi:Caleosin related protein-domain-containing protein [Hygrophoropsis aurantiaca]|uniref:Caleosin related protein-domain-containing protein n=1 Tax=Hygrophoropsis aurantiaca TaxID=72124 RepID=A0ACB8AK23_9AGAM|nr:Caleosin related protein-domain-containing protein [Hygrophoropsis aurantiaca]
MSSSATSKLNRKDASSSKKSQENIASKEPGTKERPCCEDTDKGIENPYHPRPSQAVGFEHPNGTPGYAEKHKGYSVMQQHVLYWDRDEDGQIWPIDTWAGFRGLGFNLLFCLWATIVVHLSLSLPTRIAYSYIPDPFFRIYVPTIRKDKHGSDSGVYDTEGHYISARFEDMWAKFTSDGSAGSSSPRKTMSLSELFRCVRANRLAMDPFGWIASILEWGTTWLLVQKDGCIEKKDVYKMYDGSLFYEIRDKRNTKEGWNKGWGIGGDGFLGGDKVLPFSL